MKTETTAGMRATARVAAALAAALALSAAPRLEAVQDVSDRPFDLRGHIPVYSLAAGAPEARTGSIDITTQLGSLVIGRAILDPGSFTVIGTVSPAGALSLVGVDLRGVLTIDAQAVALAPGDFQPCIFEGRWQTTSLLGGSSAGTLVAIHQHEVAGVPSIEGEWTGAIDDPGIRSASATFTQAPSGAYAGRMTIVFRQADGSELPIEMALDGQATVDRGLAYFESVGAGANILFARASVAVDPMPMAETAGDGSPTALEGEIRFLFPDGSAQQSRIRWERTTCGAAGQLCAQNDDCCSGTCDINRCDEEATCREAGQSCAQDDDCCSGICNDDHCVEEATCGEAGQSCAQNDDCCSGICNDTRCVEEVTCVETGESCAQNDDCCSGICDINRCGVS